MLLKVFQKIINYINISHCNIVNNIHEYINQFTFGILDSKRGEECMGFTIIYFLILMFVYNFSN